MRAISIFNQVLGPVMRGPSSSHTAGAYHIGCMARTLLGSAVHRAVIAFDPAGSYAVTYVRQGADRGFAMGLMGRALTDTTFFTVLENARRKRLDIQFEIRPLMAPDHPNTVEMELQGASGPVLKLTARSVGGGEVEITRINGHSVLFDGAAYESLADVPGKQIDQAMSILDEDGALMGEPEVVLQKRRGLVTCRRSAPLPVDLRQELLKLGPAAGFWESSPVYFIPTGLQVYASAAELLHRCECTNYSLGMQGMVSEQCLLNMGSLEVIHEMMRRYRIMLASVNKGLDPQFKGLRLMPACAGAIFQAEAEGRLSVRSLHTRAAARAMAVMHVDGAMGVVCAAPTGGSAGVIPGTLVTLAEEKGLSRNCIVSALFAAGAIGVIIAARATFAAEVAGCQVEIGAAGAMAAAAVVDACGGTPLQACDAAAIALQNSMGSVCDLLHGTVEIPCHTRNAAAAASAFVCADLVLGGYPNLIPLDDTIDAVYAVGKMMPDELRCTSRGGLAVTPAARNLIPLD